MIPTRVITREFYKDGGTVCLVTDAGRFYIDRRPMAPRRNVVYDEYPDDGNKVTPQIAIEVHRLNDEIEKSLK